MIKCDPLVKVFFVSLAKLPIMKVSIMFLMKSDYLNFFLHFCKKLPTIMIFAGCCDIVCRYFVLRACIFTLACSYFFFVSAVWNSGGTSVLRRSYG